MTLLERLPLASRRPWIGYFFAIVASALATWLRFEVDSALPPGFPYLTFFPAVIVTAFVFGLGPGILAATLSGLAAWFWFIPPYGFGLVYNTAVALAFYVFIVTVDIALVHWMQRANRHLAAERRRANDLAATREMLFTELQHRVGNNLQMVASLLSLQKRGIGEPEAVRALDDAARRLATVGRIQRTLYSADGEQLDLGPYLGAILRDTVTASGRDDIATRFANHVGEVSLQPAAAIPAALVVAEAVSNAIEHGFARAGGTIDITLTEDEKCYVVKVEDDGAGLPPGFVFEHADTLGLRIARNLARSLGGNFDLAPREGGQGSTATICVARKG